MTDFEQNINDNKDGNVIDNMEEDEEFQFYQQDYNQCCNVQKILQILLTIVISYFLAYLWLLKCMPIYRKYVMKYNVDQQDFVFLRKTSVSILNDGDKIQTKGKIEVFNNPDDTGAVSLYPKLFIGDGVATVDEVPAHIQTKLQESNKYLIIVKYRKEQECQNGTESEECFRDWIYDDTKQYVYDNVKIIEGSADDPNALDISIEMTAKTLKSFESITVPFKEILYYKIEDKVQEQWQGFGKAKHTSDGTQADVDVATLSKLMKDSSSDKLQLTPIQVYDIDLSLYNQTLQQHKSETLPIVFNSYDSMNDILSEQQTVSYEDQLQLVFISTMFCTCCIYQLNTLCKPIEDESGVENILYEMNKERQEKLKSNDAAENLNKV